VTTYVCFKDGVDLTASVETARAGKDPVAFQLLKDDRLPPPWTVAVTCPEDNCTNVFTGSTPAGADAPDSSLVVVGRPPTSSESYLMDAAKELGPDKSLTRASDAARFVIANISAVALVAGGFGIFSDAKGGFSDNPLLYGIVVIAAAAALACSLFALFPRTGDLDTDDLQAVRKGYADSIRHRALWAKMATGALLISLLAACAIFLLPRHAHPKLALSSAWDGSGQQLLLDVTAKATGVPEDGRTVVSVTWIDSDGTAKPLTKETAVVNDGDREVTSTVKLPATEGGSYRIRSTISWDFEGDRAGESRKDTMTVTAPPFTPPPKETPAKSS
jgi:hypothetical protein